VGFKPTIPVFERAKTVHAIDRAATVIGVMTTGHLKIREDTACGTLRCVYQMLFRSRFPSSRRTLNKMSPNIDIKLMLIHTKLEILYKPEYIRQPPIFSKIKSEENNLFTKLMSFVF
jgi:hypothetical protein